MKRLQMVVLSFTVQDTHRLAAINITDHKGHTPVHLSCAVGSMLCLWSLIDAGADLQTPSATGATPLHVACMKGQAECVEVGNAAHGVTLTGTTDPA